MLATFIERLAQMTASSTTYHETMERCADLIGKASSIQEIAPVLAEVMSATRAMALDTKLTHTELQDLRERTDAKHAEVARLQQELERASTQAVRPADRAPSTAKGLDEAMEREIAARAAWAARCAWRCSTSTTSRASTTDWATPRATLPWCTWPRSPAR